MRRLGLITFLIVLLTVSCRSQTTTSADGTTPSSILATGTVAGCPVTLPQSASGSNGSATPSARPDLRYGSEALRTELWPNGVVRVLSSNVQPDGSLKMKFPWWRGERVRGELSIEGRRLDGSAPPLRSEILQGYGDRGFQATYIIFPAEGCWEVTGRAGNASLTFVTEVVKS